MVRFLLVASLFALTPELRAQAPQGRGGRANELIREGSQLDRDGKGTEARAIFQKAIDTAPGPAAKAAAQRAMAMSWAFEGNCAKTAEYEQLVIDYWKTQEKIAPENAFYQQGEMANEAGRVCIDSGDLDTAFALYKKGHELGLAQPDIPTARKHLWDFRWEHAQARIAARRGNKDKAERHVASAKAALAEMEQEDPQLHRQQSVFLPYLTGYVALYTGDPKTALNDLQHANQNDAFILCLIGMSYDKLGDRAKALDFYGRAAAIPGHNPPAAFAHHFTQHALNER